MQVTRLLMLQAALAVGQLSESGERVGTASGDHALTATAAEGRDPAAVTPASSPHTQYSLSNFVTESRAPTATVSPEKLLETPIPNNSPDSAADPPVGSTGVVDDEELEGGGSSQALVSDQLVPVPAPVLSETTPPDTPVQTPEQAAASPPTETTGALTSASPGNFVATTPIMALNQPTPSSVNLAPVASEDAVQTPIVTPTPAETTEAAILAVPDSSSQVSELQPPPSASTLDPNLSSPIVSPPAATAATETAVPVSTPAAATTFLSVITSSTEPAFVALATDSSSSLTPTPPPPTSTSSLGVTSASTTTPTTSQTAAKVSSDTEMDASLTNNSLPQGHSSSNEYLSTQAKVAIAMISAVAVLAVMAVIGYVLWHMRLRDQRLEKGRRAAAAAAAAAAVVVRNRGFEGGGCGSVVGSGMGGKEVGVGGGGDAANGGEIKDEEMGKEGGSREQEGSGNGQKRTLIRFEDDETKRGLEKEQGGPLDVGGKLESSETTGGQAVAVNRCSTISESSDGSDGSDIFTASQKEIAVGYGLDRSDSQESEESHYSAGSGEEFRRMETQEGQRARYAHERSESLRSQWSDVQDYYGIERLETDVPARQETASGAAGDAVAAAEALESEETLVKTDTNSSTASGRSGKTIGKAV
ncbi:hypothetical protein B0T20DRAFT_407465 [Sordaria brevicollis]|uniref:Uncharacterized protein n=1 Tax=Sordaria brevicollis TaxID=83679 RepID=A0AAE0PHI6_SORBR|nr:hypothetical protein B0T20DRAFT_407465 [Sordaria brevicollis]